MYIYMHIFHLCYNILLSLQKLTQYIVNMTTIKFLWPELNS